MTPLDVIRDARRLLQDTLSPYRYSDDDLLSYVNQAIRRVAVLRPDLFGVITEIPTTPLSAVQSLPSDALRLIDLFQVRGGAALTEVDRETLSRVNPGWMAEAAGTPTNFMRHVKNPDRFFLYPAPVSGVVLVGEYARSPAVYGLADTILDLVDAYHPVLVDGVVFLAQSVDDEHVSSGRAKLFLDAFTGTLASSLQSRVVTDTKAAGLRPRASRRGVVVEGEVI